MPLDAVGPYADLMEKHGFVPADHASPKFFPVAARRLFDEEGHELPGWLRIVREDDGRTLHVASDRYKLVPNEVVFAAFETALRKSSLDLTGMRVGTDYSAGGARVFRQYLLPAHTVEVKPGVPVALRLLMLNSYDGSLALTGRVGAYNFVCANTAIHGVDIGNFRAKHTEALDVNKAAEGLATAAETHIERAERWRVWPDIRITDLQALDVIRQMPSATNALVDHLAHRWLAARDTDEKQGGPNLWCLYNVLTAWATHDPDGLNRAETRANREERVAKLIGAPVWRALAG